MTQEKTPAATEVTTSAQSSAIVAEPHTGRKLNPPTTCSGNKPPRRNERRKARDRKRWPDKTGQAATLYAQVLPAENLFVYFVYVCMGASARKPCYDFSKPKGPMCEDIFGSEVATPTLKRGFVMSEFVRPASARAGMVLGEMGLSARTAARRNPCLQHLVHPLRVKAWGVASESRSGAPTMTKVVPLVRAAAPIITLASRRAAPIQSQADITDPHVIALHAAAENALASALHLLRSIDCDPAKLQQATGRAARATTLLKRACAAQAQGVAA